MNRSGRSIKGLLEKNRITSSAPCRIDAGGTWDIKALALPLEGAVPITVNMAINLRTSVTLLPYTPGWIKVSSDEFRSPEEYRFAEAPFNSQFGLFFAIASLFQVHGVEIRIRSTSPVKAGLGGSSAAAVATVHAFVMANTPLKEKGIQDDDILHLAFHLEDAVSVGMCGLQDQGAAVFGGVNIWLWNYSRRESPFQRESVLDGEGQRELSQRILLAYSGKTHLSTRINRVWIEQFLGGKTRSGWIEVNRVVGRLAASIKQKDWRQGAEALKKEVGIRREITPEAFTPTINRLIHEAESIGCGARFAGAGGGGTVWALGEIDDIQKLRGVWADILKGTKKGKMLECAVDPVGVREEGGDD